MAAEKDPVQDARELDEVAGGADRGHLRRLPVRSVGAHLHGLHVHRLQEKRGEDLPERVEADAAAGIPEAVPARADEIDVDETAAVDAEGARMSGPLNDHADPIVFEAVIPHLAQSPRSADEIGAALDEARPRPDARLGRAAERDEGEDEDEGRGTAVAHQKLS